MIQIYENDVEMFFWFAGLMKKKIIQYYHYMMDTCGYPLAMLWLWVFRDSPNLFSSFGFMAKRVNYVWRISFSTFHFMFVILFANQCQRKHYEQLLNLWINVRHFKSKLNSILLSICSCTRSQCTECCKRTSKIHHHDSQTRDPSTEPRNISPSLNRYFHFKR